MWTSILIAALAGGAVFFVWGAISWMVLPWNNKSFTAFQDEGALVKAISAAAPTSGLYSYPAPGCGTEAKTSEEKKAVMVEKTEQMKKGPIVFAVVNRKGFNGMGGFMLRGFLIGVVASALLAFLLTKTSIQPVWKRALFVSLCAMAGHASARLMDWNWHGFPTRFTVVNVIDAFIGWTLTGLAIGALLP